MTEIMWDLNIAVLSAELLISILLIYVFTREIKRNSVKVYKPILLMGALILMQQVVSIYIYYGFSLNYGLVLSVPLFVINLFGISILILIYRILSP
ncbi:hypothetical protein ACNF42_07625 [Cuniculiplasma sp. SKW3]|uniref:hypothetical protein n=1 Tax=unclassified Cuniculiplasma TaxID=2619706 RepID=UPI003FD079DF